MDAWYDVGCIAKAVGKIKRYKSIVVADVHMEFSCIGYV
jgi:hypothetical protein